MHMPINTNQRGAVSMLTVIFLALLLTIITTSFVRLSVTEQRQSIDDDLTTRAFYAAESGVEDAKRAIAEFQEGNITEAELYGNECRPAQGLSSDLDLANLATEYTCQLIDLSPADFQAALDEWQSVTIPLRGVDPFSQITIEWHIYDGGPYSRRASSATNLPRVSAWGDAPAMLRAGFFSVPSAAGFNGSDVSLSTVFINPDSSGSTVDPFSAANDGTVVNGGCTSSPVEGEYACSMTLSNFNSSRDNYLRLQSLYKGTNVRVTLGGTLFDDVQAVIDVTGRAGDVFRRVEARVSLINNEYPLPDIALWSNSEICKDFTVTDDVADYVNNCPWGN